jgi:indolepyruvate ferredoxin oxidoreductase alpha subunit
MHLGFEKAKGAEMARKSVAIIGDSTFVHSGITPLIDLVYNKGTGTVLILDNRVTAMTGHQIICDSKTLMGAGHTRWIWPFLRKQLEKNASSPWTPRRGGVERVVREEVVRGTSLIISLRKCILHK